MLIADVKRKLMITGIDIDVNNRIKIDSYTLAANSYPNRSRGTENCGMHMEIDGCMAYLLCNDNQLVRFDLKKNFTATNPNSTTDKLEIKVIYQTKIMPCYYISKRYIHVMAEHQNVRINKATQTVTMAVSRQASIITATHISCMAGGDRHAYAADGKRLYMTSSTATRSLLACRLAGVGVVVRVEEDQGVVYVYASLKRKLCLMDMLEADYESPSYRVLGCMYDQRNRRLVVSKEYYWSRSYAITY